MKTIRELVAGDLDHNWMFASPSRISGQRVMRVLLGATALSVCVELIMVGQRKMNILQERPSIEAAKATLSRA